MSKILTWWSPLYIPVAAILPMLISAVTIPQTYDTTIFGTGSQVSQEFIATLNIYQCTVWSVVGGYYHQSFVRSRLHHVKFGIFCCCSPLLVYPKHMINLAWFQRDLGILFEVLIHYSTEAWIIAWNDTDWIVTLWTCVHTTAIYFWILVDLPDNKVAEVMTRVLLEKKIMNLTKSR